MDMEAYAIFETGGKQYKVEAGNEFDVELLDAEAGSTVKFDRVLAASDGKDLTIGAPLVADAAVAAEVVEHKRGEKLVAFKKKRRKGYHRKIGHRQELTRIRISSINA